jgi:prepilin-type N-terminal cleavage/methylation domain-containing protein
MSRADESRGFTLIELLVSMIVVATMMAGAVQLYLVQSRTNTQQDQSVAMEENLRLASAMVSDALRNARYAAPRGNPSPWTTWVPNFTSNPLVTQGSGSNPDTLSIAACFQEPVAKLSACVGTPGCPVAIGVTSVSVTPTDPNTNLTDLLDTSDKGLVRIGETDEFAFVTSVNSTSIGVDTDTAAGTQGIQKPHPIDAEICRVDVITFSIGNDPTTGLPRLLRDANQGGGAQPAAEGINDLQITLTPPKTYQVSLRGRSEANDPMTGAPLQRPLASTITLRN